MRDRKLNHRGHEVLSQKPMEVPLYGSRYGKTPRMTVFDHQRLAMMRHQMDLDAQIKSEKELHRELYDYSPQPTTDDVIVDAAPTSEVPDWVPDEYVEPQDAAPVKVPEEAGTSSLSKEAPKDEA